MWSRKVEDFVKSAPPADSGLARAILQVRVWQHGTESLGALARLRGAGNKYQVPEVHGRLSCLSFEHDLCVKVLGEQQCRPMSPAMEFAVE
jgi:ABC-type taurine transport system substrate-binding protein